MSVGRRPRAVPDRLLCCDGRRSRQMLRLIAPRCLRQAQGVVGRCEAAAHDPTQPAGRDGDLELHLAALVHQYVVHSARQESNASVEDALGVTTRCVDGHRNDAPHRVVLGAERLDTGRCMRNIVRGHEQQHRVRRKSRLGRGGSIRRRHVKAELRTHRDDVGGRRRSVNGTPRWPQCGNGILDAAGNAARLPRPSPVRGRV
mmetsp:Transcript_29294/g.83273  ORF Transcript_29294/g.83273 Transcript_29294/m.83273 type:complete len:202 (-) Transcript_29294:62-667(-)